MGCGWRRVREGDRLGEGDGYGEGYGFGEGNGLGRKMGLERAFLQAGCPSLSAHTPTHKSGNSISASFTPFTWRI